MKKEPTSNTKGLPIRRYFTTAQNSNPYDHFKFSFRSSAIKNPNGEAVFEMNNVEVPVTWSQIATDILAQKYFRKTGVPQPDGTSGGETSVKQVVHRLAACWQDWGQRYGYFASEEAAQTFYDEVVFMLLGQYAAPNSPQWFNTGLYHSYGIKGDSQGHFYVDPETGKLKESESAYERPQPHACFILSVKDDLVNEGGIMDLFVREARIFKYGSGVGTNYSSIRGGIEKLSGGGHSSGLMSFLKVGDRAAGAIKSGGTTRRAAKMVSLDLDHPEIEDFINWKVEEEKKVAALIAAGYASDYEGEAYRTVSGQNSNNSVRVPDSFFSALATDSDWELKARTDGHTVKKVPAQKLWNEINEAAWHCADPGLQFDTTINDWHTCPEGGRIKGSNPCSEYMFLDDTACNLASLNLLKFYNPETGIFDTEAFEHACRLWTIVLEISVLMAQFPAKDVAQLSYDYRTIGLGYANLGALLMVSGLPYDSEKSRNIAAAITAIMTGSAYKTSAEMASVLGPFAKFSENRNAMLGVIKNHRAAAYENLEFVNLSIKPQNINSKICPDYLLKAAQKSWDEALALGEEFGFRNAQATVIAPTGTIGLLMDCDTTGVEPDFALVKFKKLSGGGYFKIINQAVPAALQKLGYSEAEIQGIITYAKGSGSLKKAPYLNPEFLTEKGLTEVEVQQIENSLSTAFDIRFAFTKFVLGGAIFDRLGIPFEQHSRPDFDLLNYWKLTPKQVNEANAYLAGTMTLEGAPFLKPEHYAVFDCANRCGENGMRYIKPMGHLQMMAAVQPFISGAISKTVNLPHETTVEEVADINRKAWELGLKACALYRDGSKLSQPLMQQKKEAEDEENPEKATVFAPETAAPDAPKMLTEEQVLEAAMAIIAESKDTKFKRALSEIVKRKRLPDKRNGFTQKAKIDGHTIYIRTGEYSDGTLGEIFIDMYKEGASFRSLLNCFAISLSLGLQYGVPLDEFVSRFTFTRFEPAGRVEHPNIKQATSIFDYIFRLLAFEYLERHDLVHVKPEELPEEAPQQSVEKEIAYAPVGDASGANGKPVILEKKQTFMFEQTQQVLASMMGDAPACPTCGHITIRSGTCYKCLNCGSSLGCS
ncbi:vitamin B12-dependent ribonucleotide reductase [Adhaeribacter soli]|uniref:Vitamin B12-dependent ribonucleotide reductase n=1 Tax=Adhaeribacter soli TaxID=2607655 RepID=A0A5N1IK77_9BACT|nr:vitamin B12-dependent ribonucleotide reductase [Adhaeribacter soli]KAA9325679.1 vitamin B12-dependent ribonucleotide reductase [Adhaeribacter soli]